MRSLLVGSVALWLALLPAWAGENRPLKPGPKDKCPVCGMFVAKYPDWVAQIHTKDGGVFFFDGAKDMFKAYYNGEKYLGGKRAGDVAAVYVTDYYSLGFIDGREAYYVLGSDVYGPMGLELIPFERKQDAEEFQFDPRR
jgi:nitrous oxide reductase accessory protein NosL